MARSGAVLAVVGAGVALVNLDLFVVNVALPDAARDLDAGLHSMSWVLNAYAIVFAALLVPAGRFADRTSRRSTYLVGVAVFAVASAACAAATDVRLLVVARVLQAVGGAALVPASLALLLSATSPERRAGAVRAWTAIGGVAAAAGPVLGGALTQSSWRLVFLINLPVAAVTLVAGARVLPDSRAEHSEPFPDVLGAGLLVGAVGVLALGLVQAGSWGWSSPRTLAALALAPALAALLVRRSLRHPAPIVEPSLLRVPGFAVATSAAVLFSLAFAAMLLSRALWLQQVWGWGAVRTGAAIAPGPLMVPVLALAAAPAVRRWGAGPVAALGCVALGAGALQWRLAEGSSPDYVHAMLPGMLLTGIGVGLALPTLVSGALAHLPAHRFATGSGVVLMARQVGSVLGIALLVTVLDGGEAASVSAFAHGCDLVTAAALAAAAGSLLLLRRPPATVPAVVLATAGQPS